jgi:Ca2+-binding EF-hand superfamily protein
MRESFEVLDSSNTGTISSASVASMLEQMGMDNSASSLKDFFPPNGPSQLNLARYLDTLSAPLSELSHPDELIAAFEAFDVDDSGQIDVMELRQALLQTAPERGEEMIRLSEREVDGILGEFSSRRAFGGKGVNVKKSKGEVFRYRDFMAGITGGSGDGAGSEDMVVA